MRALTLAGYLALVGAALLIGMRFSPTQSWVPSAQLVSFFPVALPLALVALVLLLITRSRWPALAAAAAALVMVATISLRVVDQAGGDGSTVAGETVRVGAFNAYFGRADAAEVARSAQALELDVLCVSEATPPFAAALEDEGLDAYLPSSVSFAEAGASGTILFSRLPVRDLGQVPGVQFRMPRAAVETALGEVTVTCAHPVPPTLGGPESWNPGVPGWSRELRALRDITSETAGAQVVMGDFNATWDHRLLRRIADRAGLTHAANVTGNGLTPTWPVIDGPLPFPFAAIDHILTDLPVVSTQIIEIPGSDHRMVTATLMAEPGTGYDYSGG